MAFSTARRARARRRSSTGQLVAAGVDALLEPLHREVGQLLGDRLESDADVVELPCHRPHARAQ